jgi:hypothetical protein
VRNGSISGFTVGVALDGDGSLVEGLRVFGSGCPCSLGIGAKGIVKGNTVLHIEDGPDTGTGISATGIVTGNYVIGSRFAEYEIGEGSTVIGNTALRAGASPPSFGMSVACPSNVTNNTASLLLNGTGCNDTNNVAP